MAHRTYDTVSFLSDFGNQDEFVGVVKSVIRSIAPAATVVDLTHEIAAHDTRAGALALARAVPYVASGVVLAVVDPGVGSDRRAVAIEVAGGEGVFVGPDNGLMAAAVALTGGAERCVELSNPEYHLDAAGGTFAGRDIFGSVTGHLCLGVDLEEFGERIDPVTLIPGMLPISREEDGAIVAEVLWIDRYGNVQLNVDGDELDSLGEPVSITFRDQQRVVRRATAYATVKPGDVGIVIDAYGLASLCADRSSAAEALKMRSGDTVTLRATDS
ncbi:MAG TPA: SAM-dependent chlorinase/fluorinase [Acidimicrobiales bacterium]|nr:SAM-dependent chlorinase/fluorinase [Acidimicrobiales bacterium]